MRHTLPVCGCAHTYKYTPSLANLSKHPLKNKVSFKIDVRWYQKRHSVWAGGDYSLFKQVACCSLTHKTSLGAKLNDKSHNARHLLWQNQRVIISIQMTSTLFLLYSACLLYLYQYIFLDFPVKQCVCVRLQLGIFLFFFPQLLQCPIPESILTDGESFHLGGSFQRHLKWKVPGSCAAGAQSPPHRQESSWHTWRGRHGHLMKAGGKRTHKQKWNSHTQSAKCGWKVYT